MTGTAASAAPQRAALSRELSEFLVELSIGVHRYAMYPPGHPSLAPVLENIMGRLSELFEDRRTLSIGVARRQLVIEGVATDQKHPVLSDLARRLHEHQLGAASFEKGVTATEVGGLLGALATEPGRGGEPLGLLPDGEAPRWEHAHLFPVGYERLELKGGEGSGMSGVERANALWLGLAQAVLATGEPLDVAPDAAALARSIAGRAGDTALDQVIVGYLQQLAEELKDRKGEEAERVRKRVAKLLAELDDDVLRRLLRFGGNAAQRRQFLLDANQGLAVDSVMKVLRAAAASEGQSISSSMTRLLSKLALHAESGSGPVRSQADTALRENVEALIEGWELRDPNPEAYTNVLDAMARATPVFHTPDTDAERLTGAERLVEMALEVDAYGPIVAQAVSDLLTEGRAGHLLAHLGEAPASNRVAARIREHLTAPSQFRRLLAEGKVDDDTLRRLIDEMGSAAVSPLLDVLADSDSRTVRRRVFDALAGMGPFVGQLTVERLTADGRWFVLRNMLALLQRLEHVPEDFDPHPFVAHADPRVRREALPLALKRGKGRDRALAGALADDDERVVRMGLLELRDHVPDPVLPTLVNRVVMSRDRTAEIRALGARALSSSRSPLALNTLLELCTAGKTLFGKRRLAGSSPEVVQGLRGLAAAWGGREEAKDVLEQASRSRDPRIRAAVGGVGVHAGDDGPGGAEGP